MQGVEKAPKALEKKEGLVSSPLKRACEGDWLGTISHREWFGGRSAGFFSILELSGPEQGGNLPRGFWNRVKRPT